MTKMRLDDLMMMFTEKGVVDTVNFEELITSWAELKERRIKFDLYLHFYLYL